MGQTPGGQPTNKPTNHQSSASVNNGGASKPSSDYIWSQSCNNKGYNSSGQKVALETKTNQKNYFKAIINPERIMKNNGLKVITSSNELLN